MKQNRETTIQLQVWEQAGQVSYEARGGYT